MVVYSSVDDGGGTKANRLADGIVCWVVGEEVEHVLDRADGVESRVVGSLRANCTGVGHWEMVGLVGRAREDGG